MDRICIVSRLWLCCYTPEQTERLRRLSSFVLAYEAEEKEYDALEQPGRRRVSSALCWRGGEGGCCWLLGSAGTGGEGGGVLPCAGEGGGVPPRVP